MKTLIGEIISRLTLVLRRKPVVLKTEPPLLFFISSVMSNDLADARAALVNQIRRIPFFTPWAFEFTPASSEDLDEGYLRKVREADFVIWLVAGRTTDPVVSEIREAIVSKRRIIVFRMPADDIDEKTHQLLGDVGSIAKWVEVLDIASLHRVFELTINEEFIRALRLKPKRGRMSILDELHRESISRCLVRWRGLGVPQDIAYDLASDDSIGESISFDIDEGTSRVRLLLGDFGSGKSLTAERTFQAAIRGYAKSLSNPMPCYLSGYEARGDLKGNIISASARVGDPRSQSSIVIIDGADEVGSSDASRILDQARVLVEMWPRCQILITSRSIPVFSYSEEAIYISPLDHEYARHLISRISGLQISKSTIQSWPGSVREATLCPLYAILMATYLRNTSDSFPLSPGELIYHLVFRSLEKARIEYSDIQSTLHKIALRSVQTGYSLVPQREIGPIHDLLPLISTGLLIESSARIGFPLPIIAQWFAADSLATATIKVEDVAQSSASLELWRYPLAVLVGNYDFERSMPIIKWIAENNPGFAASIINLGIRRWEDNDNPAPLTAYEVGSRLLEAVTSWQTGISDLSKLIVPQHPDGKLKALGVFIHNNRLYMSWNEVEKPDQGLMELPLHDGIQGLSNEWGSVRMTKIGSQPNWPWRHSLTLLSDNLSRLIRQRPPLVQGGHVYQEAIWNLARKLMQKGDLYEEPLSVEDVLNEALKRQGPRTSRGSDNQVTLSVLIDHLEQLLSSNQSHISPPWPTADKLEEFHGGWIWEPFSDERTLERAQYIYSAALDEYAAITSSILKSLSVRMEIAITLPARLIGVIEPASPNKGFSGSPSIHWYLDPLAEGKATSTEIRIGRRKDLGVDTTELFTKLQSMRPEAAEWMHAFMMHSVLDIFNSEPITDLVYGWLERDLRSTDWL